MSYQFNNSYDQMNDMNNRDQFNDYQIDNEQYSIFNYQGCTPMGDEIDMNINNSFCNSNADLDNPNYYIDNFNIENLDNEYSAPPVSLRRHNPEENNLMNFNNFLNEENNDIRRDLNVNAPNNLFQNEEILENEEKDLNPPLANKEFFNANQSYLDSEKDLHNYCIIEDNYNLNNENNNEMHEVKKNEINYNERVTPNPDLNEDIIVANNVNIQNNNLSNSSSSQNTNLASSLSSSNYPAASQNSIINSSQTFEPTKNKDLSENKNEATKTVNNIDDTSGKLTKTNSQKKKYSRKNKPDNLRKKIKSRMHKNIKDIINKRLKECGSVMFFDYFPHPFIINVNVIQNKAYLKLTMRTLFKMVFGNKTKDKEKVETNLQVLNYLDSNDVIRIKSGLEIFLNSTYEDIIREYINGKIFQKDIEKLYQEGESEEYINKYRFIGKHWIDFYENDGKIKNV